MAQSIGELYVTLSLKAEGFAAQAQKASESVKKVANQVKEVASYMGGMALAFAGAAGAVVARAATLNAGVGAHFDKVKATFDRLAVDMARALLPAVDALQHAVARIVTIFERLTPAQRQVASTFVEVAAAVGVVSLAVGRLAGIVSVGATAFNLLVSVVGTIAGALGIFGGAATTAGAGAAAAATGVEALAGAAAAAEVASGGLLASMGALALAALPWIAAAAAAALAAGALYKAWEENAGGIRTATLAAWDTVVQTTRDLVATVVGWFHSMGDGLGRSWSATLEMAQQWVDGIWSIFDGLKGLLLGWVRDQAKMLGGLFSAVGLDATPLLAKLDGVLATVDKVASRQTVTAALNTGLSYAKGIAKGISDGVGYAVDGTKMLAGDVWDAAKGAWVKVKDKLKGMVGGEVVHVKVKVDFTLAESFRDAMQKDAVAAFIAAQEFADKYHMEAPAALRRGMSGGDVHAMVTDIFTGIKGFNPRAIEADDKMFTDQAVKARVHVSEAITEFGNTIKEGAARSRDAFMEIGGKLLGSLGTLGSTIENASKAALAGGPLAAVASVFVDLLTQSHQFQQLVGVLNGVMQALADVVGQLIPPLMPVIGALGKIAVVVMSALGPVLADVAGVLQQLAPSLMVLGSLVAGLMPIIDLVLVKPLTLLGEIFGKVLFPVLKTISIVILTVAKTLGGAWNAIVSGVQWVLRAIGHLPLLGKANDLANSLDGLRVNTDAMGQQIQAIRDMTFDSAMDAATQAAASFAGATNTAVEALTNVPSGWKKALRTFQAQDAQSGSTATTPPPVGAPPSYPQLPTGTIYGYGNWGNIADYYASLGSVGGSPVATSAGGATKMGMPAPAAGGAQNVYIVGYDIDEAIGTAQRMGVLVTKRSSTSLSGNSTAVGTVKSFNN